MELNAHDDGHQDFHELEALAQAGKYEEALNKHIWFHDASKHMPGMGGVRLSYALDIWLELTKKYPPALETLVDLRNSSKDKLLKGNGTFDDFHDLSAINSTLGEDEDTLLVFYEIDKNYPNQANNYYHVVENLLVDSKAFEICGKYIADPLKKFSYLKHLHEMNIKLINENPEMNDAEFKEYAESSYVNGVCQLIEIMMALGKKDKAKEIQSMALEYFENNLIREAIGS